MAGSSRLRIRPAALWPRGRCRAARLPYYRLGLLDREAGEVTDDQEQFLGVVQRNAERLLRVVGDPLFAAQVDAGKITLELDECDLASVAADAVEAARPAAAETGIELELAIDKVAMLDADRTRLAQVLDNLASNAVKFTSAGGRVSLGAFRTDDSVVLEVPNTGAGIAPDYQKQLFERFFRTASANEQAIPGTGLGLADAHGGSISVDSRVGQGTTFRVVLRLERERMAP